MPVTVAAAAGTHQATRSLAPAPPNQAHLLPVACRCHLAVGVPDGGGQIHQVGRA
jgi:hypothetical protein